MMLVVLGMRGDASLHVIFYCYNLCKEMLMEHRDVRKTFSRGGGGGQKVSHCTDLFLSTLEK